MLVMLQTSQVSRNTETTCVMINCEPGAESQIIDEILTIPGVKESLRTTGPYDILTMIESDNVESLKEIIENRIRKIPQIRATTTLVISSKF